MKNLLLLVCAALYALNFSAQVTNGLVTHYSFANGNANDLVGTSNGTASGAIPDTGRYGVANASYYFDGFNDYIDFGPDPLNDTTDITLCISYRPFTPVVPSDTLFPSGFNNEYLFSTGGQTSSIGYAMIWSKGTFQGVRRTDSQSALTGRTPYLDNSWQYSCLTYDDDSNEVALYNDCKLKTVSSGSLAFSSNVFTNMQAGKPNSVNNYYFHGLIDDIKIYDRVLNKKEIDTLYFMIDSICAKRISISPITCSTYTSPSGKYIWNTSGTYMDTVPVLESCDSIFTVNLTISNIDTLLSISNDTISSSNVNATYQWLNCDSNYAIIPGATSQTFTPSIPGSYAVEINQYGCLDTSECRYSFCTKRVAISPNACRTYTSPSGKYNWTSTGIYADTMQATLGCDSIITINLTITNIDTLLSNSNDTLSSLNNNATYQWLNCDSNYTIVSGATSQTFTPTIPGRYAVEIIENGCTDTSECMYASCVIRSSIALTSCGSYLSPSGKYIWNMTGTYLDTIPSIKGCDSIMSINLTVNYIDVLVSTSNDTLNALNNNGTYQWLNCDSNNLVIPGATNQTFSPSIPGRYAVEISENGCTDTSICTYSFCIERAEITPNVCDTYISPSGKYTWMMTGTYLDTISSAKGCDSIITVNLTVSRPDVRVVPRDSALYAVATSSTFQWLYCDNNFSPLFGATNSNYVPTINGSYAVEITTNGCIDTSICYDFQYVGLNPIELVNEVNIFPNPVSSELFITSYQWDINSIRIIDVTGKTQLFESQNKRVINVSTLPKGLYLVEIMTSKGIATKKLIKK